MEKNEEKQIRAYIDVAIRVARSEIIQELRRANEACKKFSDAFDTFSESDVCPSTLEDMIRSLYGSVTYAFKNVQELYGECNAAGDILNHLPKGEDGLDNEGESGI